MRVPTVRELPAVPDAELIALMVSQGMPPFAAAALHHDGQLRYQALQVWECAQAARQGDKGAQEVLDLQREQFAQARKDELIHDNPNRFA